MKRILINLIDFLVALINQFIHWVAKRRADMYNNGDGKTYYVIPDRRYIFIRYYIRSTEDLSEHNRKHQKANKASINKILVDYSYKTK